MKRWDSMSFVEQVRQAYALHNLSAEYAYALYKSYCGGHVPPRVPGMDTILRLAIRIAVGNTAERAAAREYVYRWNLAIKPFDQCERSASPIFGTPHTIGQ